MSDKPRLFFFIGNDDLAIQKKVAEAGSFFTDPTTASMNTSRLDMRTADQAALSNAVGASPFLAPQRLVVLDYVSKRFSGLEGHKQFLAFLETVPEFTRLVVPEVDEFTKPAEILKHWLVKWAADHPALAKCEVLNMPSSGEMPGWIQAETKRQGGKIEQQAAFLLAEMTGANTRQAALEITKLLTYVNFSRMISEEDVREVSLFTAETSVFDMVDALGGGRTHQAQELLHRILQDREVFEVFPMVLRQFRLLIMVRDLVDNGATLQEIPAALGIPPFVAGKLFKQAGGFDMNGLGKIYRRLLQMDEDSKTGGMPLEAALDVLIVELNGKN